MSRLFKWPVLIVFAAIGLIQCSPNAIPGGEVEANFAVILLANLQGQTVQPTMQTSAGPPLNVFETSNIYSVPTQVNSIASADNICQTDARYPGSGTYRAMIVQAGVRVASVSPDSGDGQVGWVFQANRRYVRLSDQQTIQIANSVGLLPFPLQNPIHPTTFLPQWTGMNTSWQTSANCSNWTSNVGSATAGDLRLTTSAMLFSANGTCGGGGLLVCVEQ